MEKGNPEGGIAFIFVRLPDRKTGSGQWRCQSKPGETTPSLPLQPVVPSDPG